MKGLSTLAPLATHEYKARDWLGRIGLLGALALGCGSGTGGVPERAQSARAALDGTFETIDVPGAVATACNGIVDDTVLRIVGRFTSSDGLVHGFLRQGTAFASVDFPEDGVNFTSANGVSQQGNIVGAFDTNGGGGCLNPGAGPCRGFALDTFGFFEICPPMGWKDVLALGANRSFDRWVGAYTDLVGGVHGWRIQPGFTTVDPPGATLTFATGTSAVAFVGRWITDDGATHGYRRIGNGDYEPIDVPGALSTVAHGINIGGVVVGEYSDCCGSTHGFVLEAGAFTTIDVPDATATVVKGISTGGLMVGVYTDAGLKEHGFLYTPATP